MSSELKKGDLSDEVWREYKFSDGSKHLIENPVALYTRPGGTTHRVLDGEGVVHCIAFPGPQGSTVLRWEVHEGCDPVAF